MIVLPDCLFIHASQVQSTTEAELLDQVLQIEEMAIEHPVYEQDKELLKEWVDPHQLKKIEGL